MMTHLSAVAALVAAATLVGHQAVGQSADYSPLSPVGEDEYEYLGCFHDNKDDRVLGDKFNSADMTTEVSRVVEFPFVVFQRSPQITCRVGNHVTAS